MGRWGDKLYESDAALDYFASITDRIMREIYYLFSPEQVKQNTTWIIYVITTIEIVLLFDRNEIGFTSYMDQEQAVKRWRETFFAVWDAEWDDPKNTAIPFHAHTYRQAHQQVASKWFDRLDELARYWSSDDLENRKISEFVPEEGLPYFSAQHYSGLLLGDLVEWLGYSIIFLLLDDREVELDWPEIEHVWMAADVMALLCETYSFSPEITSQRVENWQKKIIDAWKAILAENSAEWDEDEDKLYKNMMVSFDKLKEAARKYPPSLLNK